MFFAQNVAAFLAKIWSFSRQNLPCEFVVIWKVVDDLKVVHAITWKYKKIFADFLSYFEKLFN